MRSWLPLNYRQWRYRHQSKQYYFLRFCLSNGRVIIPLCCLVLLLNACTNPFFVPTKSGTDQNATTTPVASPTKVGSPTPTPVPPTITLQVVGCPTTLSINWDSLVGTKAHINKVQKVICGSLEGSGSVDALVNVRYYSPDAKLDYYVYDNLSGSPTRRFSGLGLLDGDAQIAPTGTLLTAEIAPHDTIQSAQDVFKEFQWTGSNFVQVLFPGMYPDMTHYQAEQDQAAVNADLARGQTSWKTSFYSVANSLAARLFHWGNISTTTVSYKPLSGIYIAQVTNLGQGGGGFVASLFRLDNVSTNILEVKQVTASDGITVLNNPASGVQLTSPINVSGSANSSGSILGQVLIYDDTFISVGNSGAIQSQTSSGVVNFTESVSYHLNALGVLEGAVAFFTTNQNNTSLSNQVVMVKVFLTT